MGGWIRSMLLVIPLACLLACGSSAVLVLSHNRVRPYHPPCFLTCACCGPRALFVQSHNRARPYRPPCFLVLHARRCCAAYVSLRELNRNSQGVCCASHRKTEPSLGCLTWLRQRSHVHLWPCLPLALLLRPSSAEMACFVFAVDSAEVACFVVFLDSAKMAYFVVYMLHVRHANGQRQTA